VLLHFLFQLGGWTARPGCQYSGTFPAQLGQEHSLRGAEYAAANGARGHVGGAAASHHHSGVPEGSGRLHTPAGDGAVVRADQCTKHTYNDQGAAALPREGGRRVQGAV